MARVEDDSAAFRALLSQIAQAAGMACANYKDGCLRRRVAVRLRATGSASFAEYGELLRRDPEELERLVETLTINVTRLYRDAAVWDALAERVLPELVRTAGPSFTAWSAGCASGEETYTLAALLHREADRSGALDRLPTASVIGTDIDAGSLRAAAQGSYSAEALQELPATLRTRYFTETAPHRAADALRALVRFERRDLLLEPPPTRGAQLITCRNVLIYMERDAQEPLLQRLHDALAPGGVLVLGRVESLFGALRALFEPVDQRLRIFRRRPQQ